MFEVRQHVALKSIDQQLADFRVTQITIDDGQQRQLRHRPLVRLQHLSGCLKVAVQHGVVQGVQKLGLLVFIAETLFPHAVPDHDHAKCSPNRNGCESKIHEIPNARIHVHFSKYHAHSLDI